MRIGLSFFVMHLLVMFDTCMMLWTQAIESWNNPFLDGK